MISNVAISVDLEARRFLAGTVSRFPYGARQVCLRFDYSSVRKGADIEVLWHLGEQLIQRDSYELPSTSGTRMYCLLKEDGSPLPRGAYTVNVICEEETLPKFHFEIY